MLGLPAVLAAQAVINWGTPTYISGDTDVEVAAGATMVWAYNFTSDSTSVVLNGVTFSPNAGTGADLSITTTSGSLFYANPSAFGTGASFYTTGLSAQYQALMQSAIYWDLIGFTTPDIITLNNLTVGQAYSVQIWVNDSRVGYFDRVNLIADDSGHSVPLRFNNGSSASFGQYVIGTFTATSTTEALLFSPASGNALQVNAMTLQALPEPGTWALLGFGVLATALLRRKAAT